MLIINGRQVIGSVPVFSYFFGLRLDNVMDPLKNNSMDIKTYEASNRIIQFSCSMLECVSLYKLVPFT